MKKAGNNNLLSVRALISGGEHPEAMQTSSALRDLYGNHSIALIIISILMIIFYNHVPMAISSLIFPSSARPTTTYFSFTGNKYSTSENTQSLRMFINNKSWFKTQPPWSRDFTSWDFSFHNWNQKWKQTDEKQEDGKKFPQCERERSKS